MKKANKTKRFILALVDGGSMDKILQFINLCIFRVPNALSDFDHGAYNRVQTLTNHLAYEERIERVGEFAIRVAGFGDKPDRYLSGFHTSRSKSWKEAVDRLDNEK